MDPMTWWCRHMGPAHAHVGPAAWSHGPPQVQHWVHEVGRFLEPAVLRPMAYSGTPPERARLQVGPMGCLLYSSCMAYLFVIMSPPMLIIMSLLPPSLPCSHGGPWHRTTSPLPHPLVTPFVSPSCTAEAARCTAGKPRPRRPQPGGLLLRARAG
jgi:hypothetical protein